VVFLVTRRKRVGGKRVKLWQTLASSDVRGRGFAVRGNLGVWTSEKRLSSTHVGDMRSSLHPDAACEPCGAN
jgi:hypothetical protein